jgi:hypothetical protein
VRRRGMALAARMSGADAGVVEGALRPRTCRTIRTGRLIEKADVYQGGILLVGMALLLGVAFPQGVVALQPASKSDERRDVVAGIVASLASTIVLGLGSPAPQQRYFGFNLRLQLGMHAIVAATRHDTSASGVNRQRVPSIRGRSLSHGRRFR